MTEEINNSSKKISAVVVTYNGTKTICSCLDSLLDSSYKVQIVVVDNASTDETLELLQNYPNIVLLQLKENIGFGQANNLGISYAMDHDSDYVFLLNQDALVDQTTIEQLFSFAEGNPEYGIISPLHLNGDGSEIDPKVIGHINRGNPHFFSDLYFDRIQTSYDLPFINAAAWLISSDCIKKVGGFSNLFFMYCEDDDYCYRVRLNGFKVAFLPDSIIYHKRISNIPTQTGWGEVKLKAIRETSNIIHILTNNPSSFFKQSLNWFVTHSLRIVKALFDLRFKEAFILLVAKAFVLMKIPSMIEHRNYIHRGIQNNLPQVYKKIDA